MTNKREETARLALEAYMWTNPETREDLLLYGNALVHFTSDGRIRRLDPREFFPDLNAMLAPSAQLKVEP